ncbi:MAG: HAMP domain-containing histidine kinase, partial [Deltaproteobacteria bacterium]|nr:HAMP domain-containing histidine kinase [Deltaproteobacteria bacterium]
FDHAVRMAEGRPLEVLFEEEPGCPLVLGDLSALRRVMVHLVENAVRYTPTGHVRIGVGPTQGGGGGIRIEDTGPGMEPYHLRAALDGVSFKGGGGGLSVGLSLARRLTELHGGTFEIRSAPGQGTTVWVTLPPAPEEPGVSG